jgi:hypothetical protein
MSALAQATSGGAAVASGAPQPHLSKTNINYIVLLFTVVAIAFVQNIPIEVRRWFNTFIGSTVGMGIIAGAYYYFNWATALMLALLLVLTMNTNILSTEEGFEPGLDTRFISNRKKWYVEQVLGENPLIIEEDTVKTLAVQDDNSGMSRESIQSGSNL